MLTAYRLHGKRCTRRAARLDRTVKNCDCSIHVEGKIGGAMVRKALHTTNWRTASLRILKAETEGFWTPPAAPKETTHLSLPDAVTEFLTDLGARGRSPATMRRYRGVLAGARMEGACLSLLEFAKDRGVELLDCLTLADMRAWRAGWTLSKRSSGKKIEQVKQFLSFCVRAEWISKSPAADLQPPQMRAGDRRATLPFEEDELCRLYSAVPAFAAECYAPHCGGQFTDHLPERLEVLMHLLESSGLRISDALMLHTKLVDGDRLFLRQQEKTGTPVCVPLPQHVIERLQSLPLFNNTHYFWDGRSRIESTRGKYSKFFLRLCKRAQVVKGHFHRFRDTFAVALLTEGVSIEHVSKLLGHRSTKITEEHYWPWVPVLQQKLEEDVRRVWKTQGLKLGKGGSFGAVAAD